MRRIFRDAEQQAHFDETGYVADEFLGPAEVKELRELYMTTAGEGHGTYDFAKNLSYYISVFDSNPANRKAANEGIRPYFQEAVDRVMVDYRILYCNFMIKEANGGEIEAHQDFTWVDESEHIGFNLWVPLQDTDETNGCFHMIEGSNHLLDSYRAATVPHTLTAYNEAIKEFMSPFPVRAGHGLLFDHKLFHFSPDNDTGVPRLAAQLVLIPKEAQAVLAQFDPKDPEHIQLLSIGEDDFLVEKNLWEHTEALPVYAKRPYPQFPDQAALLDILRQHQRSGG